jgi:hypothetical protein
MGLFDLNRDGSRLILRSNGSAFWFGAFFAGFAVFWLSKWTAGSNVNGGVAYLLGALVGVSFVIIGLAIMVPRTITTIFDLQNRRVVHDISLANGWYRITRSYSFFDVASLGASEHNSDSSYSYMPVMRLRNGETRWLAAWNGSFLAFRDAIDLICKEAEFAKRDEQSETA